MRITYILTQIKEKNSYLTKKENSDNISEAHKGGVMLSKTVRIRLTKKNSDGVFVLIVLENPQLKEIIGRKRNPFPKPAGSGLPGGRVQPNESDEEAAYRELFEETGIRGIPLKKIGEILNIKREEEEDDHMTVVFEGDASNFNGKLQANDEAIVKAEWVSISPHHDAFGQLIHAGKQYPFYRTHLSLIYRTHAEIRRYEELLLWKERKEEDNDAWEEIPDSQ